MKADDAYQAGRLLALALDHTARPGSKHPDYERLLTRWRTDAPFHEVVRTFAEGLGVEILGATPQGLTVSGGLDGPFAVRADDLPSVRAASRSTDRLLAGLVLLATAAYAYPTGSDLVEASTPAVRPRELMAFITRAAERVKNLTSEDDLDRGAALAARAWLELPPVLPGERGRLKRECQLWHTRTYLGWLAEQGRARPIAAIAGDGESAYQLTDRFRLGVSDVVDHIAFTVLAEARVAEREGTSPPDLDGLAADPGGA
ncbi:membrane protein [Parafrankia sp. EAN1pec]|uniref:hypothetical protein n=1 Tax=Parafrankia TaxID=2994362 RepID=UPI0000544099|nr:membrane protein [Frankia sp. EAN1pec]